MVTQIFPPERFGNASIMHDLSKNLVKLGASIMVLSPHPTFPFGYFRRKWKLYSHRAIDETENINVFAWQPIDDNSSFLSRMGYYLTFQDSFLRAAPTLELLPASDLCCEVLCFYRDTGLSLVSICKLV